MLPNQEIPSLGKGQGAKEPGKKKDIVEKGLGRPRHTQVETVATFRENGQRRVITRIIMAILMHHQDNMIVDRSIDRDMVQFP